MAFQKFQPDQRVKQISTGKIGIIRRYDEHPTTRTPFYHVQFDGESEYEQVLESDLQLLRKVLTPCTA